MKCAVITPIGPGHAPWYEICRRTIEAAWAHDRGPFDALDVIPMWDLEGTHGRSARRNDGVALAQREGADWLFFLDADDMMRPEAFAAFGRHMDGRDAVWGAICEASLQSQSVGLRPGQLRRSEDVRDILRVDPFLTLQMGHFVRTECAAEIGFDTGMDVGEDFKYYLAMWRRFRCAKVEDVFFVNLRGAHSTGPRSGNGGDWRRAVQALIRAEIGDGTLEAAVEFEGRTSRFAVADPFDPVQAAHCRGTFFEQGKLVSLRDRLGRGRTVVTIGADVGNDAVFLAAHADARVFSFEVDPARARLLRETVARNRLDDAIDVRGVGVETTRQMLDDVLNGAAVDLVAIDLVRTGIAGLEELDGMSEARPQFCARVPERLRHGFDAWCAAHGCRVVARGAAAPGVANVLAVPI